MLSSTVGRSSPPPLLAHLSSRRAAFLLLLSVACFLLSLLLFSATLYLRSSSSQHTTRSQGAVEWLADVHAAVAHGASSTPTTASPQSASPLAQLRVDAPSSPSHPITSSTSSARPLSARPPPTAPRAPPPDIGDPAKARLPYAEDETQLLQSLLDRRKRDSRAHGDEEEEGHGGHLHEWSAAHNHSHEVLTEAQLQRQKRQEEEDAESLAHCQRMVSELGVVVGSSWGSASEEQKHDWWQRDCDAVLQLKEYRHFIAQHPELYDPVIVPTQRAAPAGKATELPVIAICVSTTTRFLDIQRIEDLTLFKSLLPSIVRCHTKLCTRWQPLSLSRH